MISQKTYLILNISLTLILVVIYNILHYLEYIDMVISFTVLWTICLLYVVCASIKKPKTEKTEFEEFIKFSIAEFSIFYALIISIIILCIIEIYNIGIMHSINNIIGIMILSVVISIFILGEYFLIKLNYNSYYEYEKRELEQVEQLKNKTIPLNVYTN